MTTICHLLPWTHIFFLNMLFFPQVLLSSWILCWCLMTNITFFFLQAVFRLNLIYNVVFWGLYSQIIYPKQGKKFEKINPNLYTYFNSKPMPLVQIQIFNSLYPEGILSPSTLHWSKTKTYVWEKSPGPFGWICSKFVNPWFFLFCKKVMI